MARAKWIAGREKAIVDVPKACRRLFLGGLGGVLILLVLGVVPVLGDDTPVSVAQESVEALPVEALPEETAQGEGSSQAEGVPKLTAEQVERAIDSARRNIWWHRSRVIANLELGDAQRDEMDAILEAYLQLVLTEKDQPLPTQSFRRGLEEGDWAAARRGLDEVGEEARKRGMREGEMMLDVLGRLTTEQFELLRGRHGRLLNRRWLLLVPGSGRQTSPRRRDSLKPRPGSVTTPRGGGS